MIDQRHIVITGAGSGIGAALTRSLAADGCVLYVCSRTIADLEDVTQGNTIAFGRSCDVSQETQVADFVREIEARTSHVDGLVNCAGQFGAIGPLVETDSQEWLKTLEVNLFGAYLMIKHTVPLMKSERLASIVNFSGGGAFNPFANYSAYAASKAAIVRLTETLAEELKPSGISVNAVAPGFIATRIHEATLRVGEEKAGEAHFRHTQHMVSQGPAAMERAVGCVRFLLSERARFLTGKTISAGFDPWNTSKFQSKIPDINESDLYTMRRINLVDLPEDLLRKDLAEPCEGEDSVIEKPSIKAGKDSAHIPGRKEFVMLDYVHRYLDEASQVLQKLDHGVLQDMIHRLKHLREQGGRLFLLGVGGSAANASHAVNDFRKIAHIEAYAATDNIGELTARVNDEGWDTCFIEWLRGSRLTGRDMVMVFSVGGGSQTTSVNIVRAVDYAKDVGAQVMGIVSRNGGHTALVADACVIVPPQSPDTVTPLAESFQAVVWHLLATALAREEKLA